MKHEHASPNDAADVPTVARPQAAAKPEGSQCSTCIHQPYCACRGKTGHCGNYIHMATRVIGGRFDLLRFKA